MDDCGWSVEPRHERQPGGKFFRCPAMIMDRTTDPNICFYRQCLNRADRSGALCPEHEDFQRVWGKPLPTWDPATNPGKREIRVDFSSKAGLVPLADRIRNYVYHSIRRDAWLAPLLEQVVKGYQTLLDQQEAKLALLQGSTKERIRVAEDELQKTKKQFTETLRVLQAGALQDVDAQISFLNTKLKNLPLSTEADFKE